MKHVSRKIQHPLAYVVLILLLFCAGLLGAQFLGDSSVFEGAEQADKAKRYFESERCANSKLSIKINKQIFYVMRWDLGAATLADGAQVEKPKRDHPAMTCETTEISAVAFRLYQISVRDIKSLNDKKFKMGTYRFVKEDVDHALNTQKFKTLRNGTRYFQTTGEDIYVLPSEQAPTLEGDPVVIKCSTSSSSVEGERVGPFNSCNVAFSNADGLLVQYRFMRKNYNPEDYLSLHLQKVSYLESLKEK